MTHSQLSSVDQYLESVPAPIKERLEQIRNHVRSLLPKAEECISYGIPTYKLNGKNIFHFAAYEHHIGLYPGPKAIESVADQLAQYHTAKGTIQIRHDQDIPFDLITQLIAFYTDSDL